MKTMTDLDPVPGGLRDLLHRFLEMIRSATGFLAFTATLATSSVMLLKRDFAGAALAALGELISLAEDVRRQAQDIVSFWSTYVSAPIQQFVFESLGIDLPIWAAEFLTLTVFALGPVLRAAWTESARRGRVVLRLRRLSRLHSARVEKRESLAAQMKARDDLRKAIDSRDWTRVKGVLNVIGAGALGVLAVTGQLDWRLLRFDRLGSYFKGAKMAYEDLKSMPDRWRQASEAVEQCNAEIANVARQLSDLDAQIDALERADNGFLSNIVGLEPADAHAAVSEFVAKKMNVAILFSRLSIGLVGAVIGAHLIDLAL